MWPAAVARTTASAVRLNGSLARRGSLLNGICHPAMETPAPAKTTNRLSRRAFSSGSGKSTPPILIRFPPPLQLPPCRPLVPSYVCAAPFSSLASSLNGNARHVVSYRQNSNPASAFVNHDQGPSGQVGSMLIESGNDRLFQIVRQRVFRANL